MSDAQLNRQRRRAMALCKHRHVDAKLTMIDGKLVKLITCRDCQGVVTRA